MSRWETEDMGLWAADVLGAEAAGQLGELDGKLILVMQTPTAITVSIRLSLTTLLKIVTPPPTFPNPFFGFIFVLSTYHHSTQQTSPLLVWSFVSPSPTLLHEGRCMCTYIQPIDCKLHEDFCWDIQWVECRPLHWMCSKNVCRIDEWMNNSTKRGDLCLWEGLKEVARCWSFLRLLQAKLENMKMCLAIYLNFF